MPISYQNTPKFSRNPPASIILESSIMKRGYIEGGIPHNPVFKEGPQSATLKKTNMLVQEILTSKTPARVGIKEGGNEKMKYGSNISTINTKEEGIGSSGSHKNIQNNNNNNNQNNQHHIYERKMLRELAYREMNASKSQPPVGGQFNNSHQMYGGVTLNNKLKGGHGVILEPPSKAGSSSLLNDKLYQGTKNYPSHHMAVGQVHKHHSNLSEEYLANLKTPGDIYYKKWPANVNKALSNLGNKGQEIRGINSETQSLSGVPHPLSVSASHEGSLKYWDRSHISFNQDPDIKYVPYTLREYKETKSDKYFELGGLGPNTGGQEWLERKMKRDRAIEFSNEIKTKNQNKYVGTGSSLGVSLESFSLGNRRDQEIFIQPHPHHISEIMNSIRKPKTIHERKKSFDGYGNGQMPNQHMDELQKLEKNHFILKRQIKDLQDKMNGNPQNP